MNTFLHLTSTALLTLSLPVALVLQVPVQQVAAVPSATSLFNASNIQADIAATIVMPADEDPDMGGHEGLPPNSQGSGTR
jgi:hypothetical protein